jgi:nitrite reductase (NADH) large subunit
MERGSDMKSKLVVIGNGMAGIRGVEEIIKRNPDLYDITVFGAEPHVNYNRIMLSPVLAGEKVFNEIILNSQEWYDENNITLHINAEVTDIDREKKVVRAANGIEAPYDKLLIATGSNPFIIPLPGKDLEGVISFRDMKDVDTMLDCAKIYKNAVVIGGGLLGLEAANGLKIKGMNVTVIHLMDTLMERQLDEAAGFLLKEELRSRGIDIITGANTSEIQGTDRVKSVKLENGRVIAADLVVMAVGIRPNFALAQKAGLEVGRGLVVNDYMQTSDPDIYSVGECVEHRGLTYGLVAPLFEMGKVLADHITKAAETAYEGSVTSTKLKVTGVDLFSAGDFSGGKDTEEIVFRDAARGVYKRVIVKGNKIEGAVLYGDASDGAWYFQMLRDQQDISDIRDTLIFGQSFADGAGVGADPCAHVASLPDTAEICGCNGICKGDIVSAINEKGLKTLDEVKAVTKASGSCGSCAGLVEQLLTLTLGENYTPQTVKPMCKCTDHSHDDVRRFIIAKELKNMPQLMQQLEWKSSNGCSSCAPALNYYLLCAWPEEYSDDQQSRFINERAHANIQKDGTFSVIPRIWGGVTTAKELRAIADIAEKYEVPTVKLTGGQRIDLLGVKKEDLPGMWSDLNDAGMVSGHAYGKSLRTVKTCVGSEWCRFGTQKSMTMGIKLEWLTWGAWTPHKFKMAVSGCPRNCAEATIKDLGVIAVDSGWGIYVGGNGGIEVRACDYLCTVETEEELKEYVSAFMQLYREEGHYLERTAPWIIRVGLQHVKDRIVDDAEGRQVLAKRFILSQRIAQRDPWAENVKNEKLRREYEPLAVITA